jgi:integrase/recombinase XerD
MNIGKYTSQLSEYMEYKKYSVNSVENYISSLKIFLEYFEGKATKPSEISKNDIISFLKNIKSTNTHKAYLCAIKLFYKEIYKQPDKCSNIQQPRKERKLPIVFTQQEVQQMFNVCENLKHKVILSLLYGCGLRRSELINLKWEHIDRSSMILNIIAGKGMKDRQVSLPENIIPLLEKYYRQYKCKPYVLSGQKKEQYSGESILSVIKQISNKAGIKKRAYTHIMRHNCFTHMSENGIDVGYIQNSAGHKKTDTTRIYIQLSQNIVKKAISPLNNIDLK